MKLFKNDNLYINNKEDGTNQKEEQQQKEQTSKKIFEAKTIFTPKVDFKNTPLSWRIKFGYSCGHFFNDAVSSVWFCYSLLFFKLYFSNTMAGVLVLVGQVSDAVVTPVIGYFCDRQKCTPDSWFLLRAGKRKFWHIVGTLLLMVIFPLSYTYPLLLEDEGAALRTFSLHTVIYTLIIALFQGAWAKWRKKN